MSKEKLTPESKSTYIYALMTSFANYKQMNRIEKDWFLECIEKGLQEYADQYHKEQLEELPTFDDIDEQAKKQGVENLRQRMAFCEGAEFVKNHVVEGNKKEQ